MEIFPDVRFLVHYPKCFTSFPRGFCVLVPGLFCVFSSLHAHIHMLHMHTDGEYELLCYKFKS